MLPVIFSWHLGIKINDVAKSATGAMDPKEFWHAWERGQAMKIDIFGPEWDFWAWVDQPLAELRTRYLPGVRGRRGALPPAPLQGGPSLLSDHSSPITTALMALIALFLIRQQEEFGRIAAGTAPASSPVRRTPTVISPSVM